MSYLLTAEFAEKHLKNKGVFLRTDYNVPFANNHIIDDFRLNATLLTLNILRSVNATIIIGTHINEPHGIDTKYSTQLLLPWFKAHNFDCKFVKNITELESIVHENKTANKIILLENLRFFYGEQHHDSAFLAVIIKTCDYYIQDAFGTLHRNDASITVLPFEFDTDHRVLGCLVQKELEVLAPIRNNPKKPFVLLLGGGKIANKLKHAIQLAPHLTTILLGPALCLPVLHIQNIISQPELSAELLDAARNLIEICEKYDVSLKTPLDCYISRSLEEPATACIPIVKLAPEHTMLSVGPRTIESWRSDLENARTIIFAGLMGSLANDSSLYGIQQLVPLFSTESYAVAAGGDTVAALRALNLSQQFNYLSSGGGAALAYMSGEKLPGLEPFADNQLVNRTESE